MHTFVFASQAPKAEQPQTLESVTGREEERAVLTSVQAGSASVTEATTRLRLPEKEAVFPVLVEKTRVYGVMLSTDVSFTVERVMEVTV